MIRGASIQLIKIVYKLKVITSIAVKKGLLV